jgi:ABC-2 type transport system permease protein
LILARPISRGRLLLAKWLAGVLFCFLLVMVLGASALGIARLWFPWKGMFIFIPQLLFSVLDSGTGLQLYLWSHLFMAMNATVMFSISFFFSCLNVKPAAATILALSVLFLSLVFDAIPFFDRYQEWFLPHHFRSWVLVFLQPTPWARLAESQSVLLGVACTALILGVAVFHARDIKNG